MTTSSFPTCIVLFQLFCYKGKLECLIQTRGVCGGSAVMGEHRSFNEQRTTICVHHHHFGVPNGLRRCGDDPILVDRIARLKDNCAPMDIHYHHVYHCGIIICIIIKQSLGSFFTLHKWELDVAFIVLLWYVSQFTTCALHSITATMYVCPENLGQELFWLMWYQGQSSLPLDEHGAAFCPLDITNRTKPWFIYNDATNTTYNPHSFHLHYLCVSNLY